MVGHIDEIALLVSHISDKGFLHVVGSGGWDPQVLVGQRVEVLTRTGPVPGVVGRKPIHVLEGDERKKAVELKGLHVDIGARDGDEARELVREGDPIVIAAEPVELPSGRLVSRSLDNRLGVYVALEVARRVSEAGGGAGPVAAVAAVQEEIGAHGARAMAYGLQPDLAVVVDVTHATDAPGVERRRARRARPRQRPGDHARGDRQPRRSTTCSTRPPRRSGSSARPRRRAAPPTPTPTSIHLSRTGVPTAVVSIPLRYMHSPVELVELDDVEATIAVIAAMALRLEPISRWRAGRAQARAPRARARPGPPARPRPPGVSPTSSRSSAGLPCVT